MNDDQKLLQEAAKLLRRAPKAVDSMWVGTDKEPWGKQAKELARRIDAAIREKTA